MEPYLIILEAAVKRWQERREKREKNRASIDAGRAYEVEDPYRVRMRMKRLSKLATERASRATVSSADSTLSSNPFLLDMLGRERVLGKADFLGTNFLEQALAVSRFVGRIHIRKAQGRSDGFGTGFLVSPRLILTNNHVLPGEATAKYSEVEFNYEYDILGRLRTIEVFGLDPQTFFLTNEKLDYTLVAIQERSVEGNEVKRHGWCRLIEEQGKALIGDSLNIIQHPKGGVKQIVLRENQLIDIFDNYAHYETDTEPGSSGSPVFNDQWELVALHHSGVPLVKDGNYKTKDGRDWTPAMDPDDLEWIANEGIRVSSLVADIKSRPFTHSEQKRLREEMLTKEPPSPVEAAIMAKGGFHTAGQASKPAVVATGNVAGGASSNSFTYTIPLQLQVSVQLSLTSAGTQALAGTILSTQEPEPQFARPEPSTKHPMVREALRELESARERDYYNEVTDQKQRSDYFEEIMGQVDGLNPKDFYYRLNDLITETHKNKLGYKPMKHVYPWVDLQETESGFTLRSIYSGRSFDPREFIEADFRIEQERLRLREVLMRESTFSDAVMQEQFDLLEANLPYNCEHVVPQSWFRKKEPMRGDLHHLFACESGCNSFRGNIPYYDFIEFEEAIRDECGKREEGKFEPSAGKGTVARATLYFLLRYPQEIDGTSKEYTEDRIRTLLGWHTNNPVSLYEKHRNAAIYEKQGNRNPLIDFPEWADRIDFVQGLGSRS